MVSTKEFLETKIGALQKEIDEHKETLKEHLRVASDIIHRDEYDKKHEELLRRQERLEQRVANLMGRAVIFALLGAIFVAIIGAFTGHIIGG